MKKRLSFCIILLLSVFIMLPLNGNIRTQAASYLFKYKEYASNKKIKYKGTIPSYTIDGKKVDTSSTPGIINSHGWAMCNAKAVFGAAGVKVTYSSKNMSVTFKYLGDKLVLYLNSDDAVFNGEKIKSPCISYKVKYYPSKVKAVYVPSRFVAETFHMDYTWDKSANTARIITPLTIEYNGEIKDYYGTKGAIKVNDELVDNSDTPSLIFSNNAMLALEPAFEVLDDVEYEYDHSSGQFDVECGDIHIRMFTGSTYSYVNGLLETCPVAPMVITNHITDTTELYFPGRYVFETLGYSYMWDDDNKTSVINYVEEKTGVFNKDYEIVAVSDASVSSGSDYRQKFKLLIPEEINSDDVVFQDLLYDNKIRVELNGDYRAFYSKNDLVNTGEAIIQVNVLYFPDKDITQVNLCTRTDESGLILGHKDKVMDYGFRLTLDKPVNLFDKIIILDAGHGGSDPGTQHGGYNEKDVNFSVIYKYCKALFDKSDIKVYYSRYDDTLPTLYERAGLAARVGADFFISVHHNSNNNKSINGTSVYYSTEKIPTFPVITSGNSNAEDSSGDASAFETNVLTGKEMAQMFLDALLKKLGTVNRGIIDRNFVVVGKNNSVPSVLLEIGFMSNPDELSQIVKPKFQKKAAQAIYKTVLDIYEKYGTRSALEEPTADTEESVADIEDDDTAEDSGAEDTTTDSPAADEDTDQDPAKEESDSEDSGTDYVEDNGFPVAEDEDAKEQESTQAPELLPVG